MSLRERRHTAIAALLDAGPIPSQHDLAARLAARGIEATQATLSRDLKDLGVVKGPEGYRLGHVTPTNGHGTQEHLLQDVLATHVLSVDAAPPLIVLKTGPGRAQIVALELDRAGVPGVVGTIAGDDTIFLAAASSAEQKRLIGQLRRWAGLA